MRVFISADIEGTAGTVYWDNTEKGQDRYEMAARQMTKEVAAACEGALAAGADRIFVKDAHDTGNNLLHELLPRGVEVNRGWCGSPLSMVYGVDGGFDAALFIGYHTAAGTDGNPLSHTETTSTVYIKLNGEKCSEFRIYSLAAAMYGVPAVFLSGDDMLCEDSKAQIPNLETVAVKKGYGATVTCLHPDDAAAKIREGVEKALKNRDAWTLREIPSHFELEICYKEQRKAAKMAFFPGFRKLDANTILLSTDNLWDVLTAFNWVL